MKKMKIASPDNDSLNILYTKEAREMSARQDKESDILQEKMTKIRNEIHQNWSAMMDKHSQERMALLKKYFRI